MFGVGQVTRRVKRLLITGAIGLHFSLIAMQVTPLQAWLAGTPLLELARYYRALTFANRNFRFFAPAVSDDLALRIELSDANGVREYELGGGDLALRRRAMLDHFADSPA